MREGTAEVLRSPVGKCYITSSLEVGGEATVTSADDGGESPREAEHHLPGISVVLPAACRSLTRQPFKRKRKHTRHGTSQLNHTPDTGDTGV